MRILVADDERPARFVLRSMLEELGFLPDSIVEAKGGDEVVAKAPSLKAACAFVDVRMPGRDGLAAIRDAAPHCPGTKWVVVSGHAEFEYARSALRFGATEYLLKPVRPEDLEACLDRLGVRPDDPAEDPALAPVLEYLARNYNGDASVADAAALVGLTPNYLSGLFKRRLGHTISEHLARLRIEEAARLLGEEGLSVAEAARAVGYADLQFFGEKFKAVTGLRPSDFKR